MRRAIPCLAAAALLCFGAAPAHTQAVSPEHANDLLSLEQRQAIAAIRQNDLRFYVNVASEAGIFSSKIFPDGTQSIKPLAEWTQTDFKLFKYQYDNDSWPGHAYEAIGWVLFERRAAELSGDHESSGGAGGGDKD